MTIIDDGRDLIPYISAPKTTFVVDPALASAVETEYGKVDAAHPTRDPNRFTVHVPTDKTVVSIGAASPAWSTDIGITGYTDAHVHFETKVNDKTIVSLGGPATTAGIKGFDEAVPVSSAGYAMVTSQGAWHESQQQHYLLSQKGDISMRSMAAGARTVVQADVGSVDLNAGVRVNIAATTVAIGATKAITFEPVPYNGSFKGSAPSSASAKTAKIWVDRISALNAVHDLVLKATKTWKKLAPDKLKEEPETLVDVVKWGLDAVKFAKTASKISNVFRGKPSSSAGCVKIGADGNVAAVAGKDVSFGGTMGASMGTLGAATVSAGVISTLKGLAFAGIGGTLTSVQAQKRIEMAALHGPFNFSARQNVEMTAKVGLVGSATTKLGVKGAQVVLGAGHGAFIGAGVVGMQFEKDGAAFGKINDINDLKTVEVLDTPAVAIEKTEIAIKQSDETSMTLEDDSIVIKAKAIRFEAKQSKVQLNGKTAVLAP
jgi:hypothetical protein